MAQGPADGSIGELYPDPGPHTHLAPYPITHTHMHTHMHAGTHARTHTSHAHTHTHTPQTHTCTHPTRTHAPPPPHTNTHSHATNAHLQVCAQGSVTMVFAKVEGGSEWARQQREQVCVHMPSRPHLCMCAPVCICAQPMRSPEFKTMWSSGYFPSVHLCM